MHDDIDRRTFLSGMAALLAAGCSSSETARSVFTSTTFTSDRIDVTTRGQGADIVFVPGLASHRDVWARTAEALRRDYRSHLVEVGGFAGAPPRANAHGPVVAPAAEEIARYIGGKRLERPALIGHSLGATVAMMAAARHPDVAGRLMVVDMTPFAGNYFGPPESTSESVRQRADEIATQVRAAAPGTIAPMLQQMFSSMTLVDAERARILEWARASDQSVVAQAFHDVIVTDLRPELSRIRIPVTVVFARTTDEAYLRKMYANLPQVQFVRIESANHFIMLDDSPRMVAEIQRFMQT
jgi:pimeloyl-ACP methyl ester carboxylesterase